ncbi:hypothetical protein ACIBI9_64265 [Nonomuraea sp. NPDC050451]|uniref:ATP-dependent DNA ligase n=1 Tax=Nonomuraea sp. NPDC050451 TaxID=3364364 RepID=UPI0037AF2785
MLAKRVDHFPVGRPGEFLFEPKLDGFRCLAVVDSDRDVHLQSRHGSRFNERFPEVVWAVFKHLPAATIADGEIVRWSSGRLDFAALQHRMVVGRRAAEQLARTQPCHYVVFDLLRICGRDMIAKPLIERRKVLEELFASVPAAGVLALGMQTADDSEARA